MVEISLEETDVLRGSKLKCRQRQTMLVCWKRKYYEHTGVKWLHVKSGGNRWSQVQWQKDIGHSPVWEIPKCFLMFLLFSQDLLSFSPDVIKIFSLFICLNSTLWFLLWVLYLHFYNFSGDLIFSTNYRMQKTF